MPLSGNTLCSRDPHTWHGETLYHSGIRIAEDAFKVEGIEEVTVQSETLGSRGIPDIP